MDDGKKPLTPSLQGIVNRRILGVMALFALLAGVFSGWLAFNEAQELQDNLLQQVATLGMSDSRGQLLLAGNGEAEDTLILQPLGSAFPQLLPLPADLPQGIQTLSVQGETWRLFVAKTKSSPGEDGFRFAVCQRTEVRNELAWESCLQIFSAILLLTPLMMVVVSLTLHRSFAPLRTLSGQINQGMAGSYGGTVVEAVPHSGIPREISPFIQSINALLQRLQNSLSRQKRFVADAAHELRTPLAALKLLVDNLSGASSVEEMQRRLIPVQYGIERMVSLVTQLLDMARLQNAAVSAPDRVDMQALIGSVVSQLHSLAEDKGIDLGVKNLAPVYLVGHSDRLHSLVVNAVDNAIRYTPAGGEVTVNLSIHGDEGVFEVEDSGPGIPEDELSLVIQPFHRVGHDASTGTGLGLAICREIADGYGGVLRLQNRSGGGLVFRYSQRMYGG